MNEQLKQKMQLLFKNNLENYLTESGNDLFCDYVRGIEAGYMVGVNVIYDELRDQIEWVDVNERLPEIGVDVLTKRKCKDGKEYVIINRFFSKEEKTSWSVELPDTSTTTFWRKI